MKRIWLGALVAFLVTDALVTISAGAAVALGFRTGNEFGGALGTAMFVSIVAAPYCLGALAGMIVPVAVMLKRLRWSPGRATAILLGAALSVPAFVVVVIGGWLIDSPDYSLAEFVANVLRFPRSNLSLLGVFALGGAIVLSGLATASKSVGANASLHW